MGPEGAFVIDRRSDVHFLLVFFAYSLKLFDQFVPLGSDIAFLSGVQFQVKYQKFHLLRFLHTGGLCIPVVRNLKDRFIAAGS